MVDFPLAKLALRPYMRLGAIGGMTHGRPHAAIRPLAAADAREARRAGAARGFRRDLSPVRPGRAPARRPAAAASAACRSARSTARSSNNIPDWLKLTAEGRLEEAYEVSSATNNFPEICGRICPQDRLCEGNCVIEKGFESVTIGAVERHITDTAFAKGWVKPLRPRQERPQSVGIIGAGPGGLAAAEMLRAKGYQVHVYDRYDRVGGLMIYGIPGFKLEKEIVLRRWELLEEGGIQFHLGARRRRERRLRRTARPA